MKRLKISIAYDEVPPSPIIVSTPIKLSEVVPKIQRMVEVLPKSILPQKRETSNVENSTLSSTKILPSFNYNSISKMTN